jgi:hypothetical protein
MNQKMTPKIPNAQTRQELRESLENASAGLKEFSAEIQAITDELERKYTQSPIGQFHARRQA